MSNSRDPSLRYLKPLPSRLPRALLVILGVVLAGLVITATGWLLGENLRAAVHFMRVYLT